MSNSQKGGAIRLPYRWYHNDSPAFKPCGLPCANGRCPNGCALQEARNAAKVTQEGGAIRLPYRWFHANAVPFKPTANQSHGCSGAEGECACGKQAGGGCPCMMNHYNDFGERGDHMQYNRSGMTEPGVAFERFKQKGGNATGAPFYVFSQGQPLPQHYPNVEGPVFAPVKTTHFW